MGGVQVSDGKRRMGLGRGDERFFDVDIKGAGGIFGPGGHRTLHMMQRKYLEIAQFFIHF